MLFFNLETENDEIIAPENENTENEILEQTEPEQVVSEETEPVAEAEFSQASEPDEEKPVNAMGYEEPEDSTDEAPVNEGGAAAATISAVEKIVRSKTMIVSAIAYTAALLLEFMIVLCLSFFANRFAADASYFLNSLKLGYKFTPVPIEATLAGSDIPGVVLSLVITAFMIFAVWHIASLRSKPDVSKIGTSGATILQIYAIIGIVISGFMMLLSGLFGLVASIGGRAFLHVVDASLASSLLTGVFVLFAVFFLPVLLYYILAAYSLSSFKKAVKTNEPVARGSAYVGVVLILGGVSNVLGFGVLSVISFFMFVGFGVSGIDISAYFLVALLSGLLIIATAVWNFGFGSLMLKYKKSMKKIRAQFKK